MELTYLTLALGTSIDKAFYGFDIAIFKFFASIQNSFLTFVAKFFTAFGDESFVIPIAVLSLVLMLFKRTRKAGIALCASIVIGTLVTNVVVKPMALRVRPYNTLQGTADWSWFKKAYIGAGALSESDYSFPSGHTTAAFEMAVSMALVFKDKKKKGIGITFIVVACLTMCSRVYLMVHYPTDVLAGLMVGTVAGILGYLIAKMFVYLNEHKKPFTYIDRIDIGKLKIFKWTNSRAGGIVVIVLVFAAFLYSFIPGLTEGGANTQTCAYSGPDYKCYNEAKVDDPDYPPVNGKEYCKIHYKQLTGEN